MQSYKIPENLLLQAVADEAVILDPVSGNYFTLDAVGTRMIELLRESGSVTTTVERMVEEYDVTTETVHGDLLKLLDEMEQNGLVEKTGS
ncbi:hypothetical protein QQ73_12455 [Candidatus Endoriftia persephone str. Guaymas]|nr:hypothetical protein [Candidatus Endoriftia persephone str. Guaymas]